MRMKGKKFIFEFDDVVKLDCTLAGFIKEGLIKYKEVITSSNNPFPSTPSCYLTLVEDFQYLERHDEEAWLKAHNRWLSDLDEIIWRFSDEGMPAHPHGDCFCSHSELVDNLRRREKALAIFMKVFDSLWM